MRVGALGIVLFAALVPGCADKDWMIRQPAVQSTIGTDPSKAPAGKSIPPPGMGVDLGDRTSEVPWAAGRA
jgi:hypothetical protein